MTADARLHAAAEIVARNEAKRRARTGDPVSRLDAWLTVEIPRRLARHTPLWHDLLDETPTLRARQLAQAITEPDQFETDRNAAAIVNAGTAIAERNRRRLNNEPPHCTDCDDVGVTFDDNNLGRDCHCKQQPLHQEHTA